MLTLSNFPQHNFCILLVLRWENEIICWIISDHFPSISNSSRALLNLLLREWKDPTVGHQRAVTHAQPLQPFLFSSRPCFHWQNFFPCPKQSCKWKQLPKVEEVQRPEKKEKGGGGQMRKTTEDSKKTPGNSALYKSPKQKTYGGQMDWWRPWAKWCTHRLSSDNWVLYFTQTCKLLMLPGQEIFQNIFLSASGGHFLGSCHIYSLIHVSESCCRWKPINNYCMNFSFWFHYLGVMEKILVWLFWNLISKDPFRGISVSLAFIF